MEIIESSLIQSKEDLEFAFKERYGISVENLDIIFKSKEAIKTYNFLMSVAEGEGCLGYFDYEVQRLSKFCY